MRPRRALDRCVSIPLEMDTVAVVRDLNETAEELDMLRTSIETFLPFLNGDESDVAADEA